MPAPATIPKSNVASFIATAGGLGFLPKAPGTWGSLLGLFLAWVALSSDGWQFPAGLLSGSDWLPFLVKDSVLIFVVSIVGLWAAGSVAAELAIPDPQIVVVDEVAGQLIACLGLATPRTFAVSWKYLLAGFILFRVFDIWKPFPARRAEFLPGGLGIMADDWIAGAYAALGLWLIRALGF